MSHINALTERISNAVTFVSGPRTIEVWGRAYVRREPRETARVGDAQM